MTASERSVSSTMPTISSEQAARMAEYQAECRKHSHPDFLFANPYCFSCYYDHTEGGTVTPPYNTTGCPACHRSYCD